MALAGSRVAIQHPSAWCGRVGVVVQVSHDDGNASIRLEFLDDDDDGTPPTVVVAQEHLIRLAHAPPFTPARRSEGSAEATMEDRSSRTDTVTTHFRPVAAIGSKRRRLVAPEEDIEAVNTELASFYHEQRQRMDGIKWSSTSSSSSDEEHVPVISTEMTRASAGVGLASAPGLSPSSGCGDPFALVQMASSVPVAGSGEGADDGLGSTASDRAAGTPSGGSSHASGSHASDHEPSRTSISIRRSAHLDSSPESRDD